MGLINIETIKTNEGVSLRLYSKSHHFAKVFVNILGVLVLCGMALVALITHEIIFVVIPLVFIILGNVIASLRFEVTIWKDASGNIIIQKRSMYTKKPVVYRADEHPTLRRINVTPLATFRIWPKYWLAIVSSEKQTILRPVNFAVVAWWGFTDEDAKRIATELGIPMADEHGALIDAFKSLGT